MGVIYKIGFSDSDSYIGSAVNFKWRQAAHLSLLRKGKHHSYKLQEKYNLLGEKSIIFELLENNIVNELLIKEENRYIQLLNPTLNVCKIAGSRLGTKQPSKFYEKINLPIKSIDLKTLEVVNYKSATEASIKLRLDNSGIRKCISGKRLSVGGKLFVKPDADIQESLLYYNTRKAEAKRILNEKKVMVMTGMKFPSKWKPVIQYSEYGIVIKEWKNIKDPSINLSINRSSISKVCKGKMKTAGGFIWKYKEIQLSTRSNKIK